jgi:glycosyltransferase involved in cell wall biosynthesis
MNVGGTARYVGELVAKIPNSKLATGFVQGSEIEDPCLQNLNILRLPHMGRKISPINDFRTWFELRKVIRNINPEIVHTHTFKAGLIGRLIAGKHKRVHTFHGHLFDDLSFSRLEKIMITFTEKILSVRTDLLISVGKRVGLELQTLGIGVDKKWLSVPPGVQTLPVVERKHARSTLGLEENGILIGWMARMTEVKNPFLLLEIAELLTEFRFVMAGGGNLLEAVKRRAPDNVTVIGWADAATFWSAVDCAISTSNNEGMPIALIEAQLAGIPVITTDVGSSSEVIRDGITGFVSSKEPGQIAQFVKDIVVETSIIRSMGNASKLWANEEFGLRKMIDTHKEVYSTLIKNSKK